MSDLTRRDLLKVLGVAGSAPLIKVPDGGPLLPLPPSLLPLTSTSEVFVPPKGRAFEKLSFDFPEPSVSFAGLRFGFLVFSRENVYGLDLGRTVVTPEGDHAVSLSSTGFVWAGGQEKAAGHLVARIRENGDSIEWDVTVDFDRPIKAVTAIVRGVPRGKISGGGNTPYDPHDDEVLIGYPFGAGDLFGGNTADSMSTPFAAIVKEDGNTWAFSSLDDKVRAKRLFFQPGESTYRVEAVFETEGWLNQTSLTVPTWRLTRDVSLDDAVTGHYAHLEKAYQIPSIDTRPDAPPWLKDVALVVTLHGAHYTGFLFNDFAKMSEILTWVAGEIPANRVLVFLPAWDGRYYWNYPLYQADDRMGGEAGLKKLIKGGQAQGFRFMPMFGANCANRKHPEWAKFADARAERIDGDAFDENWVDWDGDRHQDGNISYMNLGVDSWRNWLEGRIADVIDRYGVEAYFLDITGGWINTPQADMHEGLKRLVEGLRARYPTVLCCGEFHYDALLSFIPFYHVASRRAAKYARFFSHLSHPAPGRGSSGVHESGFSQFDSATLSLSPGTIPTLQVVDDTFTKQRSVMKELIARAKERL
ncbi:MAG TPA: hypothetical protein VEV39_14695 [Gemmatimonadales bacterium]|nr:hypothetical protein [Gemmatimonadales bacterium]